MSAFPFLCSYSSEHRVCHILNGPQNNNAKKNTKCRPYLCSFLSPFLFLTQDQHRILFMSAFSSLSNRAQSTPCHILHGAQEMDSKIHRVDRVFSPVVRTVPPPPPHPQASMSPTRPLVQEWTHSIAGEGVGGGGGSNSEAGTNTVVQQLTVRA